MITVISLGGSIVAPDKVDVDYLSRFISLIRELLEEDAERKFIFVVGGGAPARSYQEAFYSILQKSGQGGGNGDGGAGDGGVRKGGAIEGDGASGGVGASGISGNGEGVGASGGGADEKTSENADWIGIMATRLNAELVRSLFRDYCLVPVVTNPTVIDSFPGRILVASGWMPGFSSDNDAVLLAGRFGSKLVINLSNIEMVYTADPKKDPSAKPLTQISWKEFRKMTGDKWVPGKNLPFDPVASANAEKAGIKVICALGSNLPNLKNIINGRAFTGTTIG